MKFFSKHTLFFLLAILVVMAVYFLCRPNDSKKLFGDILLMENPAGYDICIISDSSMAVKLSCDGTKWLVNNTYEADKERVDNFLYMLSQMEFLNPIPKNMQKSVRQKLRCKGVLITINKEGALQSKAYIMEENNVGLLGSLKEEEVFLIGTSGGYELDIPSTLSAEPAFWCANKIFTFPVESLREICVKHIRVPDESFCIRMGHGGKPLFTALNDTVPRSYDETVMKRYLSYFGNVSADKMITGGAEEQQALKDDLQHVIQVTTTKETSTVACIALKTSDGSYDTDKFLLYQYERKQWTLASWVRFDLLLKNGCDFLMKE